MAQGKTAVLKVAGQAQSLNEKYPGVTFKLADQMAWIDAHAEGQADNSSRSEAIRAMINRYQSVCKKNAPTLSLAEWQLCADALTLPKVREYSDRDGDRLRFLWALIDDAIREVGLDKKWNVAGGKLVEKIRTLTHGQLVAFADVLERRHVSSGRGEIFVLPGEESTTTPPGKAPPKRKTKTP